MVDAKKMSELLLNSAWKSLELTQQRIDKIEDKAHNLMTFSGVLMTINVVLIVEVIRSVFISALLLIEMILLIMCVWYAYSAVKLRKQKLLDMVDTLNKLNLTDHVQSAGDLAITISIIQQELLNLIEDKSLNLTKSMRWFTTALAYLIVVIFIYVLSVLVPYCHCSLLFSFANFRFAKLIRKDYYLIEHTKKC